MLSSTGLQSCASRAERQLLDGRFRLFSTAVKVVLDIRIFGARIPLHATRSKTLRHGWSMGAVVYGDCTRISRGGRYSRSTASMGYPTSLRPEHQLRNLWYLFARNTLTPRPTKRHTFFLSLSILASSTTHSSALPTMTPQPKTPSLYTHPRCPSFSS